MIRFKCPHCDKALSVKDESAGKKGKCPGCGEIIRIPQTEAIKPKEEPIVAVLVKEERPPVVAPQPRTPSTLPASRSPGIPPVIRPTKTVVGSPLENGGGNVQVSIEGSWGRFASADERRDYLNKVRRDSAAKAWRSSPQTYNPIPELSFTPTCPYCSGSIAKGKRPSRRSKFTCKLCTNTVYVDAWHRIFPTCYLNAKQGLVARYIGELNNMAGAAGTSEDFWWFAQQKDWTRGKCPLSDQEAGDVLWGLINYSVLEMQNILPREEVSDFAVHAQMLQELLARYRQEEKELNATHERMKAAQTKKVQLICPYCGRSLGQVKQPTRCSSRKCKLCSETIGVNPEQKLYKGPFLTGRQVFLVGKCSPSDGERPQSYRSSGETRVERTPSGA